MTSASALRGEIPGPRWYLPPVFALNTQFETTHLQVYFTILSPVSVTGRAKLPMNSVPVRTMFVQHVTTGWSAPFGHARSRQSRNVDSARPTSTAPNANVTPSNTS